MKRFFAPLLSLCLTLSLAACAAKPAPEALSDAVAETPQAAAPTVSETPRDGENSGAPQNSEPQFLVARAQYPEMAQYDEKNYEPWYLERAARGERYQPDSAALSGFLTAALPRLLAGAEGENRVCSPLNLYMALAMAAETCDGESRAQLLRLLGADSLESLEARADTLWNANYCDDGTAVSILAGSLWMHNDAPCREDTARTLQNVYHASVYRGDMSDPRYTQALRDWLNEQTGGQLKNAAENVSLDAQTVLELMTTVYFRARWLSRFDAADTSPETFHAPGGDIVCDFLHDDWADYWVYRGNRFLAVQQPFENAGNMWFLLPDEGVTPEELLSDADALTFLCSGADIDECEWYCGKLALPKLDVTSELELSDTLKALGVTDVFDAARADFSPLFESAAGVTLSEVQHAARLSMDEEGVTATAFTAMGYGAGGPQNEMDFTLDRPFLFQISFDDATPLFVGMVNHP